MGACLIEKHVIDSPEPETADSAFSLTPDLLEKLVTDCHAAWVARGQVNDGPTPSEIPSLAFRRSLYVVDNIEEGDTLTRSNVRSIRPGHGLAPKYLDEVLGRPATRAIQKGEPLDWSMVTEDIPDES